MLLHMITKSDVVDLAFAFCERIKLCDTQRSRKKLCDRAKNEPSTVVSDEIQQPVSSILAIKRTFLYHNRMEQEDDADVLKLYIRCCIHSSLVVHLVEHPPIRHSHTTPPTNVFYLLAPCT
jgi:hypothetical protein